MAPKRVLSQKSGVRPLEVHLSTRLQGGRGVKVESTAVVQGDDHTIAEADTAGIIRRQSGQTID